MYITDSPQIFQDNFVFSEQRCCRAQWYTLVNLVRKAQARGPQAPAQLR